MKIAPDSTAAQWRLPPARIFQAHATQSGRVSNQPLETGSRTRDAQTGAQGACLAARVFADGDDTPLGGVDQPEVVRLGAADNRGLDLVVPHAAEAAVATAGLAMLVGDGPAWAQQVAGWQERRLRLTACMRHST